MSKGLIQSLAHPKLARALTAMHERPGAAWSLDSMAQAAGMSRSAFSAEFKLQLGVTPADYLLNWRVSLAQSMLLAGSSIKLVSEKLGYASAASFSRAFVQSMGLSPRAWMQDRQT
jgi:transcriptional regulator GlxA family with amidase domain